MTTSPTRQAHQWHTMTRSGKLSSPPLRCTTLLPTTPTLTSLHEAVINAQATCPEVTKWRETCTQKTAENWCVIDNCVETRSGATSNVWCVYIPPTAHNEVLLHAHASNLSGHQDTK
ncbi:hypothetical protein PR048_011354 [Dryococelus australis]|uniref:Uncharacterized protein n=1 Tax=Dryococelus australis TaxID=614101 RepID=A0ABQ9HMM9_9NEOP|nr:hypothetical protein PR048_011354 [Dryococelus australis]